MTPRSQWTKILACPGVRRLASRRTCRGGVRMRLDLLQVRGGRRRLYVVLETMHGRIVPGGIFVSLREARECMRARGILPELPAAALAVLKEAFIF